MPQPTVVQFCLSGAFGGLEMSSIKMTKLFKRDGYRSIHICRDGSSIHETLLKEGLDHLAVKPRDYFAPLATLKIRRFIKDLGPTVIYCHMLRDLWLLKPAICGNNSIRVFGFARMFFKNVDKKDWLHTKIYSCIEKLIALSHIQKNYLVHCLPVAPEDYVVIPNGVDIERFKPGERNESIRKDWGVAPTDFLLGHVGRIDVQKGQEELIQAVKKMASSHPEMKLAIVGNAWTQEYFDHVCNLTKELGVDDRVIMAGHRKDTPEVLRSFDAFIMPSYEENFGNVLLEAMATGLACLGTNSGGTPEMIDDGENGLLFEPKSSDDIVRVLTQLLGDREQIKRFGTTARRKAEQVYAMDHVFAQIKGLI